MSYHLTVTTDTATDRPHLRILKAMRACKHRRGVLELAVSEEESARRIVEHLLGKNDTKSHYGPCEHPSITTFSENVPSYVLNQIRTHRAGITFDAYSMRDGFVEDAQRVLKGELPLQAVFEDNPAYDSDYLREALKKYTDTCRDFGTEAGRGILPTCYLTSFYMTCNLRTAFHLCDLRLKKDAQGQTQEWCKLFSHQIELWCPDLWEWYVKNRYSRANLAP